MVLAIAFLLLIPLIAGFPWTQLDFFVAGGMLLGTGFACELVMRKVKDLKYQIVAGGAILSVFMLIWAGIVSAE